MRRKDREMPEAFGWAVADKCEWAVLGLIDADGEVYPVPVTIVREGILLTARLFPYRFIR